MINNNLYAAIDLGSNSFHLLIVQDIDGSPRTIAKVKRKVRLASGLDSENNLDSQSMKRGWQCLSLFAERLAHIPDQNIKIVATATLRLANNAQQFCDTAQQILGLPINIISGEQEAALIYHGMAVTSEGADKRMIVDIGGASTELILGQDFEPLVLNSLDIGCVTWLARYFGDDLLNERNFKQAIAGATAVISTVKAEYLSHQWQLSLGASGSIQAVQEVLVAQGLNEKITLDKLYRILEQTVACRTLSTLDLPGLKPERKLVFASGLAILIAIFEQFNIQCMIGSGGALREALINQLIGGAPINDVQERCCQQLQHQFSLDKTQAHQVADTATYYAKQLNHPQIGESEFILLRYAATLHEIGTSVSFLTANEHGHYILSNMPMIGFSSEQQKLVAALVGSYKNTVVSELFNTQAWCSADVAHTLASCLRVAVIVTGRHQAQRSMRISLQQAGQRLTIGFDEQLSEDFPLLFAELEQESAFNPLITLG